MVGCNGVCSSCAWYEIEKKIKEQIEEAEKVKEAEKAKKPSAERSKKD